MENSNQKSSASQKTLMGILAYLGVLVIIPYLFAKNDSFVKFHIKQGLVLLVVDVIAWILAMVLWPLYMLLWIVKLIVLVLVIMGIVNVVQGKEKNLPLVGDFARYFKF